MRGQIQLGSRGSDVADLRRLLRLHGFGSQGWDTYQSPAFDRELRTAVIAFQRANGLEVDGIVGPQTWGALEPEGHIGPKASPMRQYIVDRAQALAEAEIREEPPGNRGQLIDYWNKGAGLGIPPNTKYRGEPYCVSMWHTEFSDMLRVFGEKPPWWIGASSTQLVNTARKKGRLKLPEDARPGDLVVYRDLKRPGRYYHTGLVVGREGKKLITVEGNTSGGPGVSGEGDGVFRRVRDPRKNPCDIVDYLGDL